MEKYLTKKALPGKGLLLAENAALLLLFLLLAACVYGVATVVMYGARVITAIGAEAGGLNWRSLLLLVPVILLVLVMNPLAERIRARKHARLIVSALLKSENGALPMEEMDEACKIRGAADRAMTLVNKGYLTGVTTHKGLVCLSDRIPEEAQEPEEIVPIFRD